MELRITSYRFGGWAVVAAGGELDLATAPALRQQLQHEARHTRGQVIADLAGVTFIDASGLGALIAADRRARGFGGGLRLAACAPKVIRLLRAARLDRRFPSYPAVEAAARAFTPT